jgi:hypothetical protein
VQARDQEKASDDRIIQFSRERSWNLGHTNVQARDQEKSSSDRIIWFSRLVLTWCFFVVYFKCCIQKFVWDCCKTKKFLLFWNIAIQGLMSC